MGLRGSLSAAVAVALVTAVIPAVAVVTAVHAGAVTAFTVSGTEAMHPPPHPEDLLPGYFAGVTVARIAYPASVFGMDASVAVATAGLGIGVRDSLGPVIVAGFSQGAIAVAYAKQALMALPADQRPAVDRLSFLTIGDPSGPAGILKSLPFSVPFIGLSPFIAPPTPYASVIVNGEYDAWGDFPDRPWNLVSLANAVLGILYVHGRYETIPGGLDLSTVPAANVSISTNSLGGTTTSYLIPTVKLPLVQPLRDIGIPEPIVSALEKPLKDMVDAGYTRHDAPVAIAVAAVSPAQPAGAVRGKPRQARPAAAAVQHASTGPRLIGKAPIRPRRSEGHTAAVA